MSEPAGLVPAGYGVGVLGVPAWVDVDVAVAICGLTGIAALLSTLRAARLSAAATIAGPARARRRASVP